MRVLFALTLLTGLTVAAEGERRPPTSVFMTLGDRLEFAIPGVEAIMNDSPWVADMTTLGNQRLLLTAKGVGKSVLIFRFDLRAFMKTVVTVIAAPESKNRACRLSSE